MKQPTRLIKIDRIFNIRRNSGVLLARLSNAVHLDGQQNRNPSPLQLTSECDCLGSAPAVAKDDDSGVRLVRTHKPQHVLERRGTGMIAEHLYVHLRAI